MPKVIQLLLNANRFRQSQAFGSAIATSRRINNTGLLALASLILLLGATIFPIAGKARQEVEATTGTATESSLNFTSINPTASVSLSVSDPSGTFASSTDAQMAKFSISTTNYTGYTVMVKSTNGNTLSNGASTLTVLGETVTPENFALATNTKYNNKWGILPNYYNSTANTSYLSMPASGSLTLDETSAANTTAKEYTIGLGVRADYTYAESTYYNTFIIEYIANPVTYSIAYNANAGTDTVSNLPDTQAGSVDATSITLSSKTPIRTGYDFKGWCSVAPTVTAGVASCSGTTYRPNASYGIDRTDATTKNVTTLYAMWDNKEYTLSLTISGSGVSNISFAATGLTTQNFTASNSSIKLKYGITYTITVSFSSNYELNSWTQSGGTLTGSSNSRTYTIGTGTNTMTVSGKSSVKSLTQLANMQDARNYAAGKVCEATASGATATLTDNRDNETYTVAKLADGKCWMLDNLRLNPTATTLTSSNTNVTSTVTTTFTNKTSGWSGGAAYTAAWYNLGSKTTEQSYGSGKNKVGGYYNYCAASAGTYCMASGSGSGNASSDLCPAGWRMPTGGSGGEYQTLYNKYGAYGTFKEALRASLSGYFWDASADGQGSVGCFWSSTFSYTNNMYYLYLNDPTVYPTSSSIRYSGRSVRCVLK